MFSVGASIGLLGGAALLYALDGRYNYVFYVIGPISSNINKSKHIYQLHLNQHSCNWTWKACGEAHSNAGIKKTVCRKS